MCIRNYLFLAPLLLLMSGCASMSSQECEVSDWYAVGFSDGSRGLSVSQFDRYRQDCSAHGVSPDLGAYRSGRDEGLQEFCQPERAFELGSQGRSNPGVCPPELKADFADAFRSGTYLHSLRSTLLQVERQLNLKNERFLELQSREYEIEAQLLSAQPTVEQRLQLLLELKNIADEAHALENEMLELEVEHASHRERLAAYEVSLLQTS